MDRVVAGLRPALAFIAKGLPVTVDIIEYPPTNPSLLAFIVYEDEIMRFEKLERIVIMDKLQQLKKVTEEHGLTAKLLGRSGLPHAM